MTQAPATRPSKAIGSPLAVIGPWMPLILSGLLVLLTLVVYAGVFRHKLTTWDDDKYISLNDMVGNGLTARGISWAFTTTYQDNYHPLTWVSLMIDASFQRPWVYKVTNVLLHAANGSLLFLVLWRMTGQQWASFFVAGLFLFHPLHVESVAWASERKDVLSTLFLLLALHSYVWYARSGSVVGYVLLLVFFVASLLSKQTYVTLPLLLLLLDYWPLRRCGGLADRDGEPVFRKTTPTGAIIEKLLPMSISLLAAAGIYTLQAAAQGVQRAEFSALARIGNGMVAYAAYLRKLFAPIDLAFFYPYPVGGHDLMTVAISAVVVALLTVGAILTFKRAPFVFVGWFWYLLVLLPMVGFVQVGFQAYADRYTYFSMVGLFVVIVWGGAWLAQVRKQERPGIIGVAAVLLMVCLGLTWMQVGTWTTTEAMAEHALKLNPDNPVALVQLGSTYAFKGEWDEAEKRYQRAIELDPKNFSGLVSLGSVSLSRADVEGAKQKFLSVLDLDPQNDVAQLELGIIAMGEGKLSDAVQRLKAAARRNPSNRMAWLALGVAAARQATEGEGKSEKEIQDNFKLARACFNRVVGTGATEYVGFQKEAKRAIDLLDRMERKDPTGENRFRILFHWPPAVSGARLMADQAVFLYSRNRIDYKEAIDRIEDSLKIWPNNIEARFNLGFIAAKNKRNEQADAAFSRILQLDPKNRDVLKLVEASKAATASETPAPPTAP